MNGIIGLCCRAHYPSLKSSKDIGYFWHVICYQIIKTNLRKKIYQYIIYRVVKEGQYYEDSTQC